MSRKRSRGGFTGGGAWCGVVVLSLGEGLLGGGSVGEGGLKGGWEDELAGVCINGGWVEALGTWPDWEEGEGPWGSGEWLRLTERYGSS